MTLESADTIPNEIITTPIRLYMIVPGINGGMYGPVTTYSDALAFAGSADGSVFECTAGLIDVKEV